MLILSARLPAASIAHLLRETRTSTILTSVQLARTAEEARSLTFANDNIKFINAPTFFDFDKQQKVSIKVPPVYSDYGRDDLDAIILHTSGTTGRPKPIFHAQAYVLLYATCHRLPPPKDPFRFNVSTLPLYHVRAPSHEKPSQLIILTGLRSLSAVSFTFHWIAICSVVLFHDPDSAVYPDGFTTNGRPVYVNRTFNRSGYFAKSRS